MTAKDQERTQQPAPPEFFQKTLNLAPGWLYPGEAWELHERARGVASSSDHARIVEIGSYKGRSTIALALGVRARGNGTVYAIDPHAGASLAHIEQYGTEDTYETFCHSISAAHVSNLVQPLRMTSAVARPRFSAQSIDVLFVDGSHEYEDVKADIDMYVPALRDEAAIAFNDPSHPGVYRALREKVLTSRSPFRNPRLIQNTLFFDFRRTAVWSRGDASALLRLKAVLEIRYQAARVRPYMPMWLVRVGHAASRALVGSQ